MSHLKVILLFFLFFSACSLPKKEEKPQVQETVSIAIPELKQVNKDFCSNQLNTVATYIKTKVGSGSWEEVQDVLIRSENPQDKEESLRLQRARAIIAKCANLLFGAIATGSARNLEEIDLKNAKKDIDMSVPFEKVDESNEWLEGLVPDPDKTMLLTLLGDPISSLTCRNLKGKNLLDCTKENVTETTSLMIVAEVKHSRANFKENGHGSKLTDFTKICPGGFILPPSNSVTYELLELTTKEERQKFLNKFPKEPTTKDNYHSRVRFQVLLYALKNPAYYLQFGSIRKWVIDREKDFSEKLKIEAPEYLQSKEVLELETEGAVLEQWIQAMRHADSFYYRNKYLFRAMEHIGFDQKKYTPELVSAHTVLKKTRPSSLEEAYNDLKSMLEKGEAKKEKALSKWEKNFPKEEFIKTITKSEALQFQALLNYYKNRKKQKNNIWSQVCKE